MQDYLRTLPLRHAVYLHTAFFFESIATKKGTKRVKVDKQVHHTHQWPRIECTYTHECRRTGVPYFPCEAY